MKSSFDFLKKPSYLFLIVSFNFIFFSLSSQTNKKSKLQNQYNKIQNEIKTIEALIAKTKKNKENSLDQLENISAKIRNRERLIENINFQIKYLDKSILDKSNAIQTLEKDIKNLKLQYAEMIKNTYANSFASNNWYFIFSSENFNQAFQRIAYLRKYSQARKNQAELISRTINDLNHKIAVLEEEKEEQQSFLLEEEQQQTALEEEKNKKNQLIAQLQNEESDLKRKVAEKNKAAKALNAEIQKIIEEEIRLAREKASKSESSGGLALTPEEKKLSTDFINNKGKLPWPVLKGYISEQFGKHQHPSLKSVYINNNGVDITTEAEAEVRSIFSGTVVSSFFLPTTQNSLIIKHGEYYTVYSNLKSINVNDGEAVSTKQKIGVVYTDKGLSKIHLEIWKGTLKTNPELWLSR